MKRELVVVVEIDIDNINSRYCGEDCVFQDNECFVYCYLFSQEIIWDENNKFLRCEKCLEKIADDGRRG